MRFRVLVLGGTTEATALALAVADSGGMEVVLSFAGRTRAPRLPAVPCRVGGFGGIDGLARYLRDERVDAVVDATHPFAAQISRHAAAAAAITLVPSLRLDRPAWYAGPGDRWELVPDMARAAARLGPAPRRVLLTIGQQDLAPFAARPQHQYVVRSVDPPAAGALPPGAEVITARGPFGEAGEVALLRAHRIEVLVTKNAGGTATAAKLAAARALGLAVVMVCRPPASELPTVPDVAAALAWLAHQAASARRGV